MCRCFVLRVIWAVLSLAWKRTTTRVLPALNKLKSLELVLIVYCAYIVFIWTMSIFVNRRRGRTKKTSKKIKCNSATLSCGLVCRLYRMTRKRGIRLFRFQCHAPYTIPQSVLCTTTTTSSWITSPDSMLFLCLQRGAQRCERTHAFRRDWRKKLCYQDQCLNLSRLRYQIEV